MKGFSEREREREEGREGGKRADARHCQAPRRGVVCGQQRFQEVHNTMFSKLN